MYAYDGHFIAVRLQAMKNICENCLSQWLDWERHLYDAIEKLQKVHNLQRPIYRLKTCFRSWNIWFDNAIKLCVFLKIERGCVYKKVSGSAMIIFVLYIHDILLIRNGSECIRFQHDCLLNFRWRILWNDTIVSSIYAIERIIYDMLYTKPHIYISYSKKHL